MSLIEKGLTENTVRKHVSIAKQFLTAAVRKRLIAENPFADLKSTGRPNPSHLYFVNAEESRRSSMPAPMPSGVCCSR